MFKAKKHQYISEPLKKICICMYSSIILCTLSGCGGSTSNHDDTTVSVNYDVSVADGYVENASVYASI